MATQHCYNQAGWHCLLACKGQDDFLNGLKATWRHPVSCIRNRLQYSTCSVCMNQCDSSYPIEYTTKWKESVRNGWKESESDRQNGNRHIANIIYPPANRFQEEQQKRGAVLCFGRGIINPH